MAHHLREPHATKTHRKLKSGRWQARVTYWDLDTGKRRETSRIFDHEYEAKKWKTEQEMRFRQDPNLKPPSDETLADYLPRWLTMKATTGLERKTLDSYRQMAAHAIRGLGAKPLKRLTVLDVQQLYADLATQEKSRRTIHYVHRVLKMALSDVVEWGLLPRNPADKAKARLGRREKPLRIPTPDEMRQLLEVTAGTRWHPLWTWFVTTGTRLGEALAVRWGDIDWDRGTVTIQRAFSGDGPHRVIKTPKSASGIRTISLGPQLLQILRDHKGV